MKSLTFTLLLSISLSIVVAQNVNIPDANFKNALIEKGVDTNNDSIIQVSEAEAITRLEVYGRSISDITGIEAFKNLTYFRCDTNQISTIDFTNLTKIDTMKINGNKFTSIDLSPLTELVYLNIALCQLTSINTEFNTKLEWYDVGGNGYISSLDLSKNTALKTLDIVFMNSLTSIDLRHNPEITTILALLNSNLVNIDVSMNDKLEFLTVSNGLFGEGKPKTICVSPTQDTSSWNKGANDVYSTTNCAVGIDELSFNQNKELVKIYNLLGQEVSVDETSEGVFIFQYSDGSTERKAIIE